MSSYKDSISDESVPMMAMLVAATIGFMWGIFAVNQQWAFMDSSMPAGAMLLISVIGLILGIISISKGYLIYGSMPLVASLFVLSYVVAALFSTSIPIGTQMCIIFALLFGILGVICFIGGEFNTLVSNVCFAVTAVLMMDLITFEYKTGMTGIFFIVAGAAALYSLIMNWDAVAIRVNGESRGRRRRDDYYDEYDDDDDTDDKDGDSRDFDDYDEYDRPRRRRDR